MHALAQRLEFAPPPTGGLVRSVTLAIAAHTLLLAALTWGVNWRREAPPVVIEAELWSASAIQAMARVEPPPPAPPVVVAEPAPQPQPAVVVAPPPTPAQPQQADIALQQQKKRLQKEHELELERKRLQRAQELEHEQKALEARRREQQLELQRKATAEKLKTEQEAQRRQSESEENRRLEVQRQENIKRMTGLAGAASSTGVNGSAQQSSGPSADYAGRIRAKVRNNIAYSGDTSANRTTLVEVRTSPDGTIIRRTILKPSGVEAWDEAVLKAIDKTEVLPRNADGKVPPLLELSIRPRD